MALLIWREDQQGYSAGATEPIRLDSQVATHGSIHGHRAAQGACKKHTATLVTAKLDRLSRNVHFLSGLMEAGTKFVAVDNPNANKLHAEKID
jgi:hypothetical protein